MKLHWSDVKGCCSQFSILRMFKPLVVLLLLSLVGCATNTIKPLPGAQLAGVWEHVGHFQKLDTDPVFTPAAAQRLEKLIKLRNAGDISGDYSANCIPPVAPTMTTIGAQELLVDSKKITWIMEVVSGMRWIWLDGRDNPDLEEVRLTANGYSTGRWDGDVLVVETIGFMDTAVLYVNRADNASIYPSPQMKMVERIHLEEDGNVLINERTLTDPVNLAQPWVTTVRYERRPDWEIEEYICSENNRTEEY